MIWAGQPRRRTVPICTGCLNEIDPETCWCGASHKGHGNPMDEGHPFVPMGCRCLMSDEDVKKDSDLPVRSDWPFPWPRPTSIYDDDGPRDRRGRQYDIVVYNVLFMVSPTGDRGSTSGRARYRVDCQDCNMIIHENTTSASAQIRHHLAERHDLKVRW